MGPRGAVGSFWSMGHEAMGRVRVRGQGSPCPPFGSGAAQLQWREETEPGVPALHETRAPFQAAGMGPWIKKCLIFSGGENVYVACGKE